MNELELQIVRDKALKEAISNLKSTKNIYDSLKEIINNGNGDALVFATEIIDQSFSVNGISNVRYSKEVDLVQFDVHFNFNTWYEPDMTKTMNKIHTLTVQEMYDNLTPIMKANHGNSLIMGGSGYEKDGVTGFVGDINYNEYNNTVLMDADFGYNTWYTDEELETKFGE